MNSLAKLCEAALFASARPISFEELQTLDPEASPAALRSALDELRECYDVQGHGVELMELGEGWQILTRAEYVDAIERAQLAARPARLSAAALETLAIIAYRQPIGRGEIEEIRGVNVGGVLKSLHERGLVDIVGRAEGLGRPLLYGTTPLFLEQFALRHLAELPRADELAVALRPLGGDAAAGATAAPDADPAAADAGAESTDASAPDAEPTPADDAAPVAEADAPVIEESADAR
ncbi:MAG: SMC-Scp complex subunit ScpB [Gemmatimonadaceae bacterium]|nr:SMC-Scp complex subunit ScpB [Gemmatimonadaceae bacterium]